MEVSRFRVLFLTLLAATVLPGCSMLGGRANDKPEPVAATSAAPPTWHPRLLNLAASQPVGILSVIKATVNSAWLRPIWP